MMRSTPFFVPAVIVLFSIGIFHSQVWSGITGKIAGSVKDKATGEPLPGVNVVIEDTRLGAATHVDGNYVILNVPPGIYTVVASMVGYQSVRYQNIRVSVDLTTTVDFSLSEETIKLGEEVVIVAEREIIQKDMTGSLAAVGADEIENIPVQEIRDVLQLQAGVIKDDFGNLHVRGGRSGEVAFWVDGVSATDGYDGKAGIAVENSSVQELQVISGTFNAEYGQAMSGIINVVTKEGGAKYHGEISGYTGDYLLSGGSQFELLEAYRFDRSRPGLYDIRGNNPVLDNVRGLRPVNPLSGFDGVLNLEGSLSGPAPFTKEKVTFFTNVRYFNNPGWLKGIRWFTPQGRAGDREFVDMNPLEKLSLQGKVSHSFTPTLKLTYNHLYSNIDFRDYDHFFRYNPEGNLKKFDDSQTQMLTLSHTLSAKTFYELKLTNFSRNFKQFVFEDPTDGIDYVRAIPGDTTSKWIANPKGDSTGYVHPDSLIAPDFSFARAGTNTDHLNRTTEFRIAKIDLTSQVSRAHLIKAGLEARFYDLSNRRFNIVPQTKGGEEVTPFQPTMPPPNSPQFFGYSVNPLEFSAYVQDKMEFKNVIVNLGLRFDYFDSDGRLLADPTDPDINDPFKFEHQYKQYIDPVSGQVVNINSSNLSTAKNLPDSLLIEHTLAEKEKFWFKDTKARTQLSPRFGIAYPITDRGVIHFSYGYFFQIPLFEHLYDRTPERVTRTVGAFDNVYANPGLKPQKTVMYELGLQQQLGEDLGFDLTLFYRDIRDWVGTGLLEQTAITGVSYATFENQDYSNVRGITLALTKRYSNNFSAALDYTFQVAEGSNSNPNDAFEDLRNDRQPRISLIPLNWDQRHTLNGNVSVGTKDWRVSLIGRYWSGLPYTPRFATGTVFGGGSFKGLPANSDRRPNQYTVDLRVFKSLKLAGLDYSVYFNVYNLFDRRNEQGVYDDTGTADYTLDLRNASSDPNRIATADFNVVRPNYYSEPRQIQVGASVSF